MAGAESTPPKCLILDDDELAAAAGERSFRNWREPAANLAAARIFGGGGTPAASTARQFPAAFHTYRPAAGGPAAAGGSPFQFFKGKKRPAARVETPEGTTTAEGSLTTLVRTVFDPSGAPLQVYVPPTAAEEMETEYRYAACTPPCYSPKTPPYFPIQEPDGSVTLPPAALEGGVHQSGGEA